MGKKKSKNQEAQSVWEWICKTWYAYKAKPFWAILMAVGMFLGTGILNSFFGNFFDDSIVIKSVTLFYDILHIVHLAESKLAVKLVPRQRSANYRFRVAITSLGITIITL